MNYDYNTEQSEPEHFQCRHIHADGRRCASPCLRTQPFCYFHHTNRSPVSAADRQTRRRRGGFALPSPAELADRSGIQMAIGTVLQRIASNELDTRRAGLLLYGLQIASLTLVKDNARPKPEDFVEEVVEDPALGTVATEDELEFPAERMSAVRQLAKDWAEIERRDKEKGLDLQASASNSEPNTQNPQPDPTLKVPCSSTSRRVPRSSTSRRVPHVSILRHGQTAKATLSAPVSKIGPDFSPAITQTGQRGFSRWDTGVRT